MYRETCNPEARRHILVSQQGIGRDPSSKLARELPGLLNRGLWHQNDELISPIAGYHIRPPAVLFENVPHSLQNHVTFEMAIEIVYKLEPIEVHQHDCECAVRARGALPF